MPLRVAFLGNDPWSVPALEALDAEPELSVALVVTNPAKPAGRGDRLRPTAVADAARAHALELLEASGVATGPGLSALLDLQPDVIVVVAYGHLLPREVIELAPHGAINLHFSLLPRWRGAAPVQRALAAGDTVTGVTVMRIDEGLDTGPILNQLEEPIRPDDDAGSLGMRLARNGSLLLTGVVRMLPSGGVPARPQDHSIATVAPRIRADERAIDWERDAADVVRWIRALSPEPGATTTFREQPLKVLAAALDHQRSTGDPGTIMQAGERGVLVRAGDGGVRLVTVAPAGRAQMAAGAWGRGARFQPGERLG